MLEEANINMKFQPYIREGANQWILGNDFLELVVAKDRGVITRFTLKKKDVEALKGERGGLVIEDGLKVYSDLTTCKVKGASIKEENRTVTITLSKTFEAAELEAITRFSVGHAHVRWENIVRNASDVARGVNIYFLFPCLKQDSYVFVPHHQAPLSPQDFACKLYIYGGDQYRGELGISLSLPSATVYDPKKDYGLTFVAPFETPKPQLHFIFLRDAPSCSFILKYAHLKLDGKGEASASTFIVPHEGDWRPGLKWMLNKYSDYFSVKNERVFETEGAMICAPRQPEEVIKQLREEGLGWQELQDVNLRGQTLETPEEIQRADTITLDRLPQLVDRLIRALEYKKEIHHLQEDPLPKREAVEAIREYIKTLHRHGVAVFLYFHPTFCGDELALKRFNESIVKEYNGKPFMPGYGFFFLMNPDPAYPWAHHVMEAAQRLLEDFPECDGFFIDELHYRTFDFAHQDGVTMLGDKPCYMLGFAMEKIIAELCHHLHEHGKAVWANGPTSIEVVKYVDGIMAESSDRWLGYMQYMGLAKPIIALPPGYSRIRITPPAETERYLKMCLKCGAQLSARREPRARAKGLAVPEDTDQSNQFLVKAYRPLLDLIKGRRWVLNAHALELPDGTTGNIFQVRGGHYAVPVVTFEKSILDEPSYSKDLNVKVRLEDANEITNAYLLSVDYEGWYELVFQRDGEEISIDIPKHSTASLILLTKKGFQPPNGTPLIVAPT